MSVRIPAEALRTVRSGFIDTIATLLAGRDEPVTTLVRDHVRAKRSALTEASLLLGEERAGAADAALVNGVAAHALDYDDVALAGHPSTVLVPAVMQLMGRWNWWPGVDPRQPAKLKPQMSGEHNIE